MIKIFLILKILNINYLFEKRSRADDFLHISCYNVSFNINDLILYLRHPLTICRQPCKWLVTELSENPLQLLHAPLALSLIYMYNYIHVFVCHGGRQKACTSKLK